MSLVCSFIFGSISTVAVVIGLVVWAFRGQSSDPHHEMDRS